MRPVSGTGMLLFWVISTWLSNCGNQTWFWILDFQYCYMLHELASLSFFFSIMIVSCWSFAVTLTSSIHWGWKGANSLTPLSIKQLLRCLTRAQCPGAGWWGVGERGNGADHLSPGCLPVSSPPQKKQDKAGKGGRWKLPVVHLIPARAPSPLTTRGGTMASFRSRSLRWHTDTATMDGDT